jgi:hypothetical protein
LSNAPILVMYCRTSRFGLADLVDDLSATLDYGDDLAFVRQADSLIGQG